MGSPPRSAQLTKVIMVDPIRLAALPAALALALSPAADAQYNERPDPVGSGSAAVDCSGRSIKNPRVRAIHSEDPDQLGGTGYFLQRDPFLAYQLGRNLNLREFRSRDGVFGPNIAGLGGPMPDGTTAKITARNQTSCAGCHNLPNGNAGGGPNFHKDSGFGRNTPHYYGGGILEMLALQVREEILLQVDTNDDGWVSAAEAQASPVALLVDTGAGSFVDYGTARLSNGATGAPALNNIFRVWFVDAAGVVVPGADSVDGITTHGFNFEMVVFGWGQGPGRSALNPTTRAFYWDPANSHGGLDAHDPSTLDDPDGDGASEPTLAGAVQFPATHRAPDQGADLDPLGFSRDDPDADGFLTEISEGDLDLAEWFMLNAPRPAFAGTEKEFRAGVKELEKMGCTTCHVTTWQIRPQDDRFAGDRRFFDLEVTWNPASERLEGRLERLYVKSGDTYERSRAGFEVEGLFSDLAHHDMGVGFAEIDFGGVTSTVWRTPPLWGVGSTFPWGHDGQSLTLEDVIQRHGGEAAASRAAWLSAGKGPREKVLNLLRKLVLYDVESLPADIDGDGQIADDHLVAGISTGPERLNAEWLFETPVKIQGFAKVGDQTVRSFAGMNLGAAYGLDLPLRVDSDLDGWPDVWDHAPFRPGYRDGVR